jgi:hypothetical protein
MCLSIVAAKEGFWYGKWLAVSVTSKLKESKFVMYLAVVCPCTLSWLPMYLPLKRRWRSFWIGTFSKYLVGTRYGLE